VTGDETRAQPFAGVLEALHRILNREPEADEVLRQAVALLHDRIPGYGWVGLSFVEEGELVLGPSKGEESARSTRLDLPVSYGGRQIASLGIASSAADPFGSEERAFLERVAVLVSAQCLVGWDTGGVPWSDVR
jgi:putative methionine-R-sulfoxide reductase with GAF domain